VNLHFGADDDGALTGMTYIYEPFQDFTHIVDYSSVTYFPWAVGANVSTFLEPWQGSECPTGGITKESGVIVPKQFALHQNYPNPFNPNTTIAFDIGNFTWVRLDIINVLGQTVATLIDSPMDAGSYDVEWNAGSDISSGIYFYKIEAGDFTETKKMLLLK